MQQVAEAERQARAREQAAVTELSASKARLEEVERVVQQGADALAAAERRAAAAEAAAAEAVRNASAGAPIVSPPTDHLAVAMPPPEAARVAELEETLAVMQAELDTLRRASREARAAPIAATMSNKKDEDDGYDLEAAMLSGGGANFMPLVGAIRGSVLPCAKVQGCLTAANALDRLSIMLDQQPLLRMVLVLYVLLLHVAVIVV